MPKTSKRKPEGTIRDANVQLRLRPMEKAAIAKAARLRDTTLSKFVLDHAIQAAEQVLADQVQFTLSANDWKAFCDALDASPRVIPKLKRLLAQPSVFDDPAVTSSR